jgi:hypothetical protein
MATLDWALKQTYGPKNMKDFTVAEWEIQYASAKKNSSKPVQDYAESRNNAFNILKKHGKVSGGGYKRRRINKRKSARRKATRHKATRRKVTKRKSNKRKSKRKNTKRRSR